MATRAARFAAVAPGLGARIALVLATTLLAPAGFGQTIVSRAEVRGNVEVNSNISHNVQIMAFSPPGTGNPDYSNFRNDVMTQTAVDGVTLEIDWSSVETPAPSSTPCSPINTDVCQLDSVGQYHQYSWSSYTGRTGSGIDPWFDPFGGALKKVNLILSGIGVGGAGTNKITPWYVTSSSTYLGNFSTPRQDVLNAVKDCNPGTPWAGTGSSGAGFSGGGTTTVTVNAAGCCSTTTPVTAGTIFNGDMIWVSATGAESNFANMPQYGTPASVNNSGQFTYQTTGANVSGSCLSCIYIGSGQSSPVPYEQPYLTAWEAFIAAANLHFGPNYQVTNANTPPAMVTVGSAGTNQIGYVRSGTWSGGESFAYCITGGTYNGLTGMGSPYAFVSTLNSSNTWLIDYQKKVNYVQSLNPTTIRYWPIDTIANQTWYPDSMAQGATAASNSYGHVNGFGSQGLSLLDAQNGCTDTAGDWCNLFTNTYHVYGMPLELQQISISNPDIAYGSCTSSNCGTPPKFSGDMRSWLPFAVTYDATVIEMYYQDLGLAFDGNYCSSISCTGTYTCYAPASSNITPAQECGWFTEVGQAGDLSYASTINTAHGPH
jgi:hypothetical protein